LYGWSYIGHCAAGFMSEGWIIFLGRDGNICKRLIINKILKNESLFSLKFSHIFGLAVISWQ